MDPIQHPDTNTPSSLFQMNLDAQNSYNLRSAASWAKVLGVVGIISGVIFLVLLLIVLDKLGSRSYRYSSGYATLIGTSKLGVWIWIAAKITSTVGGIFSFNFGNKISAALRANNQNGLNEGFAALRNLLAVRSILIIIFLLFFLLGLSSTI